MPAYIVSIKHLTRDSTELEEYARKAVGGPEDPLPDRRLATSSGRFRSLLNGRAEGMSILEFPDFDAAQDWFHSPHYQDALQHLVRGADYEMFLVEGETELFAKQPRN